MVNFKCYWRETTSPVYQGFYSGDRFNLDQMNSTFHYFLVGIIFIGTTWKSNCIMESPRLTLDASLYVQLCVDFSELCKVSFENFWSTSDCSNSPAVGLAVLPPPSLLGRNWTSFWGRGTDWEDCKEDKDMRWGGNMIRNDRAFFPLFIGELIRL